MSDAELSIARVGVIAALGNGDTGLAYQLVLGLMDVGYPFPAIMEELLTSIQLESGRRWEVGDYSISEEHASTAAIETLISLLTGSFEQSVKEQLIVVVCAEGDTHTLPARMASALLVYEGFRTIFLGTSVPASDLHDYLARTKPDALVVSCTRPANLRGARACIVAGHDASVPVVVGGRAFGDGDRAAALGADAHASTLTALSEIVGTWQPNPAVAEQNVTVRPQTVPPLESIRVPVVTKVIALLTNDQVDGRPTKRIVEECAGDLFDTMIAAVYLDDHTLIADHVVWLARLLASQARITVSGERLLECLSHALADLAPEARAWIDASAVALPPHR